MAYAIDIDSSGAANNGFHIGTTASHIIAEHDGIYSVHVTLQLENSDTQIHDVTTWLRKNGTDVEYTAGQASVPASHGGTHGTLISSDNYVLSLSANDYIQLMWHTDDVEVFLSSVSAGTTPTTPMTPSVSVDIAQIMYTQLGPQGPQGPSVGPDLVLAGNVTADYVFASNGNVTASSAVGRGFFGNGYNISHIAAGNITSGQLANARLPTNVNIGGTFNANGYATFASDVGVTGNLGVHDVNSSGNVTVNNGGFLFGNGYYVGALNAANVTTGTLNNARLPTNVDVGGTLNANGAVTFSGNVTMTNSRILTLSNTGVGTQYIDTLNNNSLRLWSYGPNNNGAISFQANATTVGAFGRDGLTVTGNAGVSKTVTAAAFSGPSLTAAAATALVLGAAAAEKVRIDVNGNVGIGNAAPAHTLSVQGTSYLNGAATATSTLTVTGNVRVGSSTAAPFQLDLTADTARKLTTTTWATGSDARVKSNVEYANLDMCYDVVKAVPLRRFEWDAAQYPDIEDRSVVGWIAQEVEAVFPKAVSSSSERGFNDFRTLSSDQIYKTMYGALQRVIADKEALEARVALLEVMRQP